MNRPRGRTLGASLLTAACLFSFSAQAQEPSQPASQEGSDSWNDAPPPDPPAPTAQDGGDGASESPDGGAGAGATPDSAAEASTSGGNGTSGSRDGGSGAATTPGSSARGSTNGGQDGDSTSRDDGAAPKRSPAVAEEAAEEVETLRGHRIRYGVTGTLVRFAASRLDNEPGRLRNYTPNLELIPPEVGFQFTVRPSVRPWRLPTSNGSTFQLMSYGGVLLARLGDRELRQNGLSLAATLAFFNETVGFGIGMDLYRGIPVQGADGTAGGATAYTGLLAWALSPHGELTPENAFVLVTFNLTGLLKAVSGEQ